MGSSPDTGKWNALLGRSKNEVKSSICIPSRDKRSLYPGEEAEQSDRIVVKQLVLPGRLLDSKFLTTFLYSSFDRA